MSRRTPRTIWFATLADLWRLLLLTAGVLVTVIAFAAAVKPLAEGRLTPLDTLQFMLLAVVPMSQYALPFAAGFSATLAFHRMAQDNELVACYAGGIGHRTILVPAAVTGLVLAGALALLTDQVIPRFLRSMEEMLTADVTKLLVTAINRGESVQLDRTILYADSAETLGPDPRHGAYQRLRLFGVLAVGLDRRSDRVVAETSAREALAWLFRETVPDAAGGEQPVTVVQLRIFDAVGTQRGTPGVVTEGNLEPFVISSAFKDDPKFLTGPELRRLREQPELMNFIQSRRRALAQQLVERAMTDRLVAAFRTTGRARMTDDSGQTVELAAADMYFDNTQGVRRWILVPPADRQVQVSASGPGLPPRTLRAARATLSSVYEKTTLGAPITMTLELTGVAAVTSGAGAPAGRLAEYGYSGLRLADDPAPGMLGASNDELLRLADERFAGHDWDILVRDRAADLRRATAALMREITSKQQERLAATAACFVMVIIGAVMAMRLRDSLPLTVYLWSFFPALLAVLTISAGQQIVHEHGPAGLLLLWGGVAGLALYAAAQYRRLAMH